MSTTSVRELALHVSAHHRLPDLAAARSERAADLHALRRDWEAARQAIGLWERVVFFSDSPNEQRAATLRAEVELAEEALALAEKAHDDALKRSWAECPPLEIAQHVERVITASLADPAAGRGAPGEDALCQSLESLADRILALWLARVDRDDARAQLIGALGAEPLDCARNPPLRIADAALTAARVLRTGVDCVELAIDPNTGCPSAAPAAFLRAVYLASLSDLRRAVDEAFPGLSSVVTGRRPPGGATAARSPFRVLAVAAGVQPTASDLQEAIYAELDGRPLWPALVRALRCAAALRAIDGAIEAASGDARTKALGWLGLSPEEALERLRHERTTHHRGILAEGVAACREVCSAASLPPVTALSELLVTASLAVADIATSPSVRLPNGAPSPAAPIFGVEVALENVDRVIRHLGDQCGLRGTWNDLVDAVIETLQHPSGQRGAVGAGPASYDGVVRLVAGALRGTPYVALVSASRDAALGYARSVESAHAAEARVTVGEHINFLVKSKARATSEAHIAEARSAKDAVERAAGEANALIQAALAASAPAAGPYFAALAVREAVTAIRPVSTRAIGDTDSTTTVATYSFSLEGYADARVRMARLGRECAERLGPLVTPSAILAQWVARRLREV